MTAETTQKKIPLDGGIAGFVQDLVSRGFSVEVLRDYETGWHRGGYGNLPLGATVCANRGNVSRCYYVPHDRNGNLADFCFEDR